MKKIDARQYSRDDLHLARQQVVKLHLEKMPVMKIVETTGLSWPTVNAAIKAHLGGESLTPFQRGRKRGTGRILSVAQELELQDILYRKRPSQVKVRHGRRQATLWCHDTVKQLMESRCGVQLSDGSVANYLVRWGFPVLKPKRKPYKRCHKSIKTWLDTNYITLEQRAQAENTVIVWFQKDKLTITDESGRKLSRVFVSTNQGKLYWLVVRGSFTTQKQQSFLRALAKNDPEKQFLLIRDNLSYFTNREIHQWIATNKFPIELFPPPEWGQK